jgi:hypothetical protein
VKGRTTLSPATRLTVAGLLVATIGVIIQIASGADYPTVPPVFFIQLLPAALIAFGRWWWAPAIAVLAGLFLTFGLFASREAHRLFDASRLGDAAGLWIQMLAIVVAIVAGIAATIHNHRRRSALIHAASRE